MDREKERLQPSPPVDCSHDWSNQISSPLINNWSTEEKAAVRIFWSGDLISPSVSLVITWRSLPLFLSLPSPQEANTKREKSFPHPSITLFPASFLQSGRTDGWAGSKGEEERGSSLHLSRCHSISEGEALGHVGKGTTHTRYTHSKGKGPLGVVSFPSRPN